MTFDYIGRLEGPTQRAQGTQVHGRLFDQPTRALAHHFNASLNDLASDVSNYVKQTTAGRIVLLGRPNKERASEPEKGRKCARGRKRCKRKESRPERAS